MAERAERVGATIVRLARRCRAWLDKVTDGHTPVVILAGTVSFVASVLGIVQWWADSSGDPGPAASSGAGPGQTASTTAPPDPPDLVDLGAHPLDLVTDGETVWLLGATGDSSNVASVLMRVESATRGAERVESRAGAPQPQGLAVAAGQLWLAQGSLGTVRIDPVTLEATATVPVGDDGGTRGDHIALAGDDDGRVWLVTSEGATGGLYLIDPSSAEASWMGAVNGTPAAVAAGDDVVWVVYGTDQVIGFEVSSAGGGSVSVQPRPPRQLARGVGALALGHDHLWACDEETGGAVRLGTDEGAIRTGVEITGCADIAVDPANGEDVWVVDDDTNSAIPIDGATTARSNPIRPLRNRPVALTVTHDAVWVALADGELIALDP
jgi:hypothetical protein